MPGELNRSRSIATWLQHWATQGPAVNEQMNNAVRLSVATVPQMLAGNSYKRTRILVDLLAELCMIHAAMQHGDLMNYEQTADLLKRAAVRLSQSYCAEIEKERDRRWDGDAEQADNLRDEAEEVRLLIEECRAAAARFADDRSPVRSRVGRRGIGFKSSPSMTSADRGQPDLDPFGPC